MYLYAYLGSKYSYAPASRAPKTTFSYAPVVRACATIQATYANPVQVAWRGGGSPGLFPLYAIVQIIDTHGNIVSQKWSGLFSDLQALNPNLTPVGKQMTTEHVWKGVVKLPCKGLATSDYLNTLSGSETSDVGVPNYTRAAASRTPRMPVCPLPAKPFVVEMRVAPPERPQGNRSTAYQTSYPNPPVTDNAKVMVIVNKSWLMWEGSLGTLRMIPHWKNLSFPTWDTRLTFNNDANNPLPFPCGFERVAIVDYPNQATYAPVSSTHVCPKGQFWDAQRQACGLATDSFLKLLDDSKSLSQTRYTAARR